MNLQILQEAEDELNEAVASYEEIETGLGIRLKEEARNAIQWIRTHPDLARVRPNGYRREIERMQADVMEFLLHPSATERQPQPA